MYEVFGRAGLMSRFGLVAQRRIHVRRIDPNAESFLNQTFPPL